MTVGYTILISAFIICTVLIDTKNIPSLLIATACSLPADIPIIIGQYHFYPIRIITILAFIKLFLKNSNKNIQTNRIDILFICTNIILSLAYIIKSSNGQQAIIYCAGRFVDTILLYYVLRMSISEESIKNICKMLALSITIFLPFVISEYLAGQNLFAFFGRTRIAVRAGEIRAAATFSHPILFGTFAASSFPILFSYYKSTKNRKYIIPAIICIFYTLASSSSGPIISILISTIFLSIFFIKKYGKHIYIFILSTLTFIHIFREKPIWHLLFVRIKAKQSSTGYHRYLLINAAIEEFKNWWFLGYGDQPLQWHQKYWPWAHAKFTDITNHYLLIGVRGGLLPLILFLLLCHMSLVSIWRKSTNTESTQEQWLWFGFAISLIIHYISFLSVSYFGQIELFFYMSIAISAMAYKTSNSQQ